MKLTPSQVFICVNSCSFKSVCPFVIPFLCVCLRNRDMCLFCICTVVNLRQWHWSGFSLGQSRSCSCALCFHLNVLILNKCKHFSLIWHASHMSGFTLICSIFYIQGSRLTGADMLRSHDQCLDTSVLLYCSYGTNKSCMNMVTYNNSLFLLWV